MSARRTFHVTLAEYARFFNKLGDWQSLAQSLSDEELAARALGDAVGQKSAADAEQAIRENARIEASARLPAEGRWS